MMKKVNDLKKRLTIHIGMRKMKSVLAVFLAFCCWQIVRIFFPDLERHPVFLYIYSVLEIRDSTEKTVTLGKSRIKATFVGLAVGLPILAAVIMLRENIENHQIQTAIEAVLLLFGVLISLTAAEQAKCGTMCGLSTAILIVLIASHAEDENYLYPILRVTQTIGGVFIAWLINVWLFPYEGKEEKSEHP